MSQTLYKDTLKISKVEAQEQAQLPGGAPSKPQTKPTKENKVNRICDAFLGALKNRIATNLQNLITAHVCKLPPDIESGLQLVARLRGMVPSFALL